MKATLEEVFQAVHVERDWQDAKWGTIQQHPHTVGEWLLILESEAAEAREGWVQNGGDAVARLELLQVLAVGVACLEQHGFLNHSGPVLREAVLKHIGLEIPLNAASVGDWVLEVSNKVRDAQMGFSLFYDRSALNSLVSVCRYAVACLMQHGVIVR
jgi:hypothetical protein